MKSFKSLILFSVVLLGFGFLFVGPAAAKDCPTGGSYNSTTNKCEADPLCPDGRYDTSRKSCLQDPTYTCMSDKYTFNPHPPCSSGNTYWCEGEVVCPCGVFVPEYGYCDAGSPPCPSGCPQGVDNGKQSAVGDIAQTGASLLGFAPRVHISA